MGVPLSRGGPALARNSLVAGVETLSDACTDAEVDFAGWVSDYQRPLLAFAQLVAGDRQTGEDLLQVALAHAYLKWPKISGPGQHPHGYVRRIIVNENASLWRRAWKRRERSTDLLPQPADAAPADRTWALVQALPARQRTAIGLRYYADLSVAEAAETMGCSEGAVKTHTSRAIAKLREHPSGMADGGLRRPTVRPGTLS